MPGRKHEILAGIMNTITAKAPENTGNQNNYLISGYNYKHAPCF
jgi:hypothetical protein